MSKLLYEWLNGYIYPSNLSSALSLGGVEPLEANRRSDERAQFTTERFHEFLMFDKQSSKFKIVQNTREIQKNYLPRCFLIFGRRWASWSKSAGWRTSAWRIGPWSWPSAKAGRWNSPAKTPEKMDILALNFIHLERYRGFFWDVNTVAELEERGGWKISYPQYFDNFYIFFMHQKWKQPRA